MQLPALLLLLLLLLLPLLPAAAAGEAVADARGNGPLEWRCHRYSMRARVALFGGSLPGSAQGGEGGAGGGGLVGVEVVQAGLEGSGESHTHRGGYGRREQCCERGCSIAGFRVQGAGCRVQGAGCRVQGALLQGSGFRVQGAGCPIAGFRV